MTQSDSTSDSVKKLQVPDKQAFLETQDAFQRLEADGITRFQMFNALADLFNREQQPELSKLMADAAYKCYQQGFD